jgi:hypothetical protein
MNAELVAALASAFAAIVLAVFAGVQLRQEQARKKDHAKTARVQLSGIAYLLRARLQRWLGVVPRLVSSTPIADWISEAQSTKALLGELAAGREEARQMLALAAEAPESPANATRVLYVNFLEGARRVEEHVSTSRPINATEFWRWIQLVSDAEEDFRACLVALEADIIEPFLLNSESSVRRRREEEEPFAQLARALGEELDSESIVDSAPDTSKKLSP